MRSYRSSSRGTRVGGITLQATVDDKAVRLALRKMRRYAARDARDAMRQVAERELPAIRRGVPLGDARKGHLRDKLVVRARTRGYPYITALGRFRGHLGILEWGGTRRDIVRSKRHPGRVLWSGARRHPRTMYVTRSLQRNTPRLAQELRDVYGAIAQEYIRAAGTFRGRVG